LPKSIVYLLFTLGGTAALIYEVLWMRSFRLVFGSSTQAAGAVLASYFMGMALGGLLGARLSRGPRPIRLYGWSEIIVGISALGVGAWLTLFRWIYPQLYAWVDANPVGLVLGRLLLAFVALAPPTIAMGVTLPLLVRALVDRPEHVARRSALLYALNIAGAVLGVVLAGFVLPMSLGLAGCVYLAVGLNLLIGVAALFVREEPLPSITKNPVESSGDAAPVRRRLALWLLLMAAASGFGSLALEVIYFRILGHHTECSVYSFALMLAIFLLFMAVGSAAVAVWGDRVNPWRWLAWTQLAAVAGILVSPLLFQLVPFLAGFSPQDTLTTRLLKLALGSAVVLGPPVMLIGMVLPCTWKLSGRRTTRLGTRVGVLTAVNTVAAVTGSLIAGFICLPRLGLAGSTLLVAAVYATVAMGGFLAGFKGIARWGGCCACVALVASWALWGPRNISSQALSEGETLISYREGEAASVAVIQRPDGHRSMVMNHEYILGSSLSAEREARQGRLPLVLHPSPKRVAFIGLGTGITASAALDFPVEQTKAVELVPGVALALPKFERWNRSFYTAPGVELVVEDGRNYLLGTSKQFDVIVSDLFVPWHAGTGDLYTIEHFQATRRRLAPRGIFAQWLPGYLLTVEELRIITASFLEVFPSSTLWRNDFHATLPSLCLVGHRDGLELDPAAVAAACERMTESRGLHDLFVSSPAGLTMLYVCGDAALRDWAECAPLNTDRQPRIEYESPRTAFIPKQDLAAAMHELLAGFRPPVWCYPPLLTGNRSVDEIFRAADLLAKANRAALRNNFEQEFRYLIELVDAAGDLPAVAAHIVRAAGRYRDRRMGERSEQLLSALVEFPEPPVVAIVALARVRQAEDNDVEASSLLQRAVERAPNQTVIRRRLVELLKRLGQFEQVEPHLRHLMNNAPDDPILHLDLAYVLHRQGKTEAAAGQIAEFRKRWDGRDGKRVWQHLRRLELGAYFDAAAPAPPTPQPPPTEDSPSP